MYFIVLNEEFHCALMLTLPNLTRYSIVALMLALPNHVKLTRNYNICYCFNEEFHCALMLTLPNLRYSLMLALPYLLQKFHCKLFVFKMACIARIFCFIFLFNLVRNDELFTCKSVLTPEEIPMELQIYHCKHGYLKPMIQWICPFSDIRSKETGELLIPQTSHCFKDDPPPLSVIAFRHYTRIKKEIIDVVEVVEKR